MPRKRNKGARVPSPDKPNLIGANWKSENQDSVKVTANIWTNDAIATGYDTSRDASFNDLQEKFKNKVDGEVVYYVLQNCNFNVEKATEQLETMAESNVSRTPEGFSRLPLKPNKDRSQNDDELPFLSPKTPSTIVNPSSYFNSHMNADYSDAIAAFDTFGKPSAFPSDSSLFSTQVPERFEFNASSSAETTPFSSRKQLFADGQSDSFTNIQTETSERFRTPPKSEKSRRKHNVSLDPQERESLEKLIEEVITLGSDQVISAGNTSSSDGENEDGRSDSKDGQRRSGKKDKGAALAKQYQSQMKVAMKHMKNLPPRFVKKLEVAKQYSPESDGERMKDVCGRISDKSDDSPPQHIPSPNTVHKSKFEKKRKERLIGIDQFLDEGMMLNQSDDRLPNSTASLLQNILSDKVSSLPNSERNSRSNSPHISQNDDYEEQTTFTMAEDKTTFSITAPEFVPRTATPVCTSTIVGGVGVATPATLHPQPFPAGPATKRGMSASHVEYARLSPVAGPIAGRVSPHASSHFAAATLLTAYPPAAPFSTPIRPAPYIPASSYARPSFTNTTTNSLHATPAQFAWNALSTTAPKLNHRLLPTRSFPDLIQPVLTVSYERSPDVAKVIVARYKAQNLLVMVILRGCPGSGKTTLAQQIVGDSGVILSSDDYFQRGNRYEFDHNKLGEAHEWNQTRTKVAITEKKNPIIIDNTNTMSWEMRSYIAMGMKYDYHIELMEPDTPWRFNVKELVLRNKHGVSKDTIQKMVDRYQHGVTVESIMGKKWIQNNILEKQKAALEKAKKKGGIKDQSTSEKKGGIKDQFSSEKEDKCKTISRQGKSKTKEDQLEGASAISPRPADSGFHESSPNELEQEEIKDSNQNVNRLSCSTCDASVLSSSLENAVTNRLIEDFINEEVEEITKNAPPIGTSFQYERSRKLNLTGFTDEELTELAAHLKIVDRDSSFEDENDKSTETRERRQSGRKFSNEFSNDEWLEVNSAHSPPKRHKEGGQIPTNYSSFSKYFDEECQTSQFLTTELSDKTMKAQPRSITKEKKLPKYRDNQFTNSTQTGDLKEKTEFLISCFPDLKKEFVEDLIRKCDFDVDEVCDILSENKTQISKKVHRKVISEKKRREKQRQEQIEKNHIPSLVDLSYQNIISRKTEDELKVVENKVVEINKKKVNLLLEIEESRSKKKPDVKGNPKKQQEKLVANSPSQDHKKSKSAKNNQTNNESPLSDMIFVLPKDLAAQLLENFGSVGFEIDLDSMTDVDMRVRLNIKAAKGLHRCWSASIREQIGLDKFQSIKEFTEEEADRKISQKYYGASPEASASSSKSKAKTTAPRPRSPPLEGAVGGIGIIPFRELQDEETAREEQDRLLKEKHQAEAAGLDGLLSTQLKRDQLYEKYSELNKTLIDDVFEQMKYNYSKTEVQIKAILESMDEAEDDFVPGFKPVRERKRNDHYVLKQQDEDEDFLLFQNLDEPQYKDFRAEAANYYEKRKECYEKAREAHSRKDYHSAQFYTELAERWTTDLKEANVRASHMIIDNRREELEQYNQLDLHYLHVNEAIEILSNVIDIRRKELHSGKDKRKRHLVVITGQGNKSKDRRAKIKPAVLNFLKMRKINFCFENEGAIKLQL